MENFFFYAVPQRIEIKKMIVEALDQPVYNVFNER